MSLTIIVFIGIAIALFLISIKLSRSFKSSALFGDAFIQSLGKKENRFFPFRYFQDENGRVLPIVALGAFFRTEKDKQRYQEYIEKGIKIIGITSYKSFPKKIHDLSEDKFHLSDTFDYVKEIKNWLCCFRDASNFGFRKENVLSDQSESDFYDVDQQDEEKKYDFIYICNKDNESCDINGWNAINRNYRLALSCFPILITEMKLKGLIVGRVKCGLEQKYGPLIETTDFLPYHELQKRMRQSRFLFVPNVLDASPRVVSECLVKGVPVLMNRNILCGFKYVNDETGVFFADESDIRESVSRILNSIESKSINPRAWWKAYHGVQNASRKLGVFLNQCYPELLSSTSEVRFIL